MFHYSGGSAKVYRTYAEAAEAINELPWMQNLPPAGTRVIKVKLQPPIEVEADYPTRILDALAEV